MEGIETITHNNPLLTSSSGIGDDPMLSYAISASDRPLSPFGGVTGTLHFASPKNRSHGFQDIDDDLYNNHRHSEQQLLFSDSNLHNDSLHLNGIGNATMKNIKYFNSYGGNLTDSNEKLSNVLMEDTLSPSTSITIQATPNSSGHMHMYDGHFIFTDDMISEGQRNHQFVHLSSAEALYPSASLNYSRQQHFDSRTGEVDTSLLSPTILETKLTSSASTCDTTFENDCESAGTSTNSSGLIDAPLSVTTTISSNCSANEINSFVDGRLNNFSSSNDSGHFTFLSLEKNFLENVKNDSRRNSSTLSILENGYDNDVGSTCEFDADSNFDSAYKNIEHSITDQINTYEKKQSTPTVRVITKYRNLPPLSTCIQPYPKTIKIEKRISHDINVPVKYTHDDDSSAGFYDSHNLDGRACSSKCSTPSSISSTINSVVVKSMNYANCSNNSQSSYMSAYTPFNPRPMNIIVNDMSAHQILHPNTTLLPSHHYGIKVEQKLDYCIDDNGIGNNCHLPVQRHVTPAAFSCISTPVARTATTMVNATDGCCELDELNTHELAQRISQELKRYSIPQAIFAQRVLCRSQGTLSDLLRNPKPWSKLKSGRETFRRMAKWLQEPEFQRMSSLRIAACKRKEEQGISTLTSFNNVINSSENDNNPPVVLTSSRKPSEDIQQEKDIQKEFQNEEKNQYTQQNDQNDLQTPTTQLQSLTNTNAKKPRLVFTDLQRRTLYAIFNETKRPSREMQLTISQKLNLDPNTVANFFMNARRRGHAHNNDSTNSVNVGVNGNASLPVTPPPSSSGSGSLSPTFASLPAFSSWSSSSLSTGSHVRIVNIQHTNPSNVD